MENEQEPLSEPSTAEDVYHSSLSGEAALDEKEVTPWGPWWSLLWSFVAVSIWTVAQALLVGGAYMVSNPEKKSFDDFSGGVTSDGDLMGSMAFGSAGIGCLVILLIVKVRGVSLAKGLGLRAPKWWVWLLLPFATFLLLMVLNLAITPFQTEKALLDKGGIVNLIRGTDWIILLLLGVAVGAPFFEEFLFRGLLHEGLKQSFLGTWGSAIVTGLAFSAMHIQYQDLSAFLFLFLLGVALVAAREWTGSLWVPIAMHAIQNTLATVPMFLFVNGVIPEDQMPEDIKEIIEQADQQLLKEAQALEVEAPATEASDAEWLEAVQF